MSDRKSRFNLFRFKKNKNNSNWSGDDNKDDLGFPSFESIIPESSPLKNDSDSSSGFYNDDLMSNNKADSHDELDGVDEKYAKYLYSPDSKDLKNFENYKKYESNNGYDNSNPLEDMGNIDRSAKKSLKSNGKLKEKLLDFKTTLLNKDSSSKTLFGKITFALIFLVLISSIFYFFVYQPFQNELDLERNTKLNEINSLYKGPLEVNDNAYSLKNQVNEAYDVEEIKSIDVLMFATKDWRMHHSKKIVDCKDDFGRIMMSYGNNKNIIMSVKDANDFIQDNDARILSNVQFEKVNTVIVPISLSRLQATGGLISVGSVVDIYSLSDNSTESEYMMEESIQSNESMVNGSLEREEDEGGEALDSMDGEGLDGEGLDGLDGLDSESLESESEGPVVSGATVLAILRSKDSGIVDSTLSKSNTIIKGNKTNPFENTSTYSTDVEEQLKKAVLNSSNDNGALDSYLTNYGVRLSNFERMSNLGDLDSEYIILLEVPQGDVNFVINNMGNIILTIPTEFAPNWVVSELNQTYYENLYQSQSLDFF